MAHRKPPWGHGPLAYLVSLFRGLLSSLLLGACAGEDTRQTVIPLVTGKLEYLRHLYFVYFSHERIKPPQRKLYGPGLCPRRRVVEPNFVVDGISIKADEAFNQVQVLA